MTACVFDTDVVIAALDRGDVHHREAAAAVKAMVADDVQLLISTINYAEALVRPAEDEQSMRAAVDAIASIGLRPVPPSASVARDAARYRGLGISLADGFALATARARSAAIASFDARVLRAVRKLDLELPTQFA